MNVQITEKGNERTTKFALEIKPQLEQKTDIGGLI